MKRIAFFLSSFVLAASVHAGHGMGGCMHGGMGLKMLPVSFAVLALGYWVLRIAEKEGSKLLKRVGRFVAVVILLGGIGGILCPFMKCCRGDRGMMCGYSAVGGTAPMMEGQLPADAAPAKKR